MPQVPYNPVPDQVSSGQATPGLNINASIGAFGGAVGHALEGLGEVEKHVGDEIFTRALAMQNLQNETEAKEADAAYMIKAGELHANYSSLQGQSAVDAYPKYMDDLQSVRKDVRAGLSNDMARKMYDGSSLSTMGRTIFNGAGHAATQGKVSALHGSQSRVDAQTDFALSFPKDDVAFQRGLNGIAAEMKQQAEIGGWSDDELNSKTGKAISSAWANRIEGLSRTNPWAAKDMLEANRDSIRGQDLDKVDKKVTSAMHTTGARNISDAVNQGWAPYMRAQDIDKAQGLEESLVRVVQEAQRAHPEIQFTIGGQGGRRTPEQQAALVARGVSQTMDSDHLSGKAVDLVPIINGQPDYKNKEAYKPIMAAMQEASEKLGIPLQPKSLSFTNWDPAHYALPKDYDPRTAPKPVEESLKSRTDRAEAYARKLMPDDSGMADAARDRTISDFSRQKGIKRDQDYTNRNTIDSALVGGFGDGKIPTNVDELKATDPKTAAAYDALDATQQKKVNGDLARAAKGDQAWDAAGVKLRRYQTLKGMANDDPVEFLSQDIVAESMPNSAKRELINLQQKKISNSETDPRVHHAMQVLKPMIGPANLTKEELYQFNGAMQDALTDYQTNNKKFPDAKAITEIGTRLLQEQHDANKWSFGVFNRTTPMYQIEVPDTKATAIKADPYWKDKGIIPTDQMIQRIYTAQQYQKLYGAKQPGAK